MLNAPKALYHKLNPLIEDEHLALNMATVGAISRFNAALMLTVIFFWGSSFVVAKIALNEGLTPLALATFRFLVAGVIFIGALLIRKGRDSNYRLLIEARDAPTVIVLALTGVTFFFIAQYTGIELAGASVAAIFVTLLSPIFIAVLSARALDEPLTRGRSIGIAVAAAGTLIVITSGMTLSSNGQFLLGSLISLLTPILWATYNMVGKKTIQKYDSFLIVAYVSVIGGLGLLPFSLAENSLGQIFSLSTSTWLAILFLSLACSLFGYYIWFYVLKQVGATVTSSFLFLEPLITVVLAATLIGERVGLLIIAGGALIFLGVHLITRNKPT